MVKFVWLTVPGGGRVPVNPDQVQYLRAGHLGATTLVFGAGAGGLHELVVEDDAKAVVLQLEERRPTFPVQGDVASEPVRPARARKAP